MLNPSQLRDWNIYKITSPTNRVYIGVTSNIIKRKRCYSGLDCKTQPILYASLNKYGFKNHQFEVVDSFNSAISYAHDKEMFWIRSYMSNGFKYPEQRGMNRTDGGQGTIGLTMSDEQKLNQSKRVKGFKHTEEAKKKISEAGKGNKYAAGIKQSAERIELSRRIMKGNKFRLGLATSRLQRQRTSEIFSKPILQFDLNGVFIKEFPSMKLASSELKISNWSIWKSAKGEVKKPTKFIFKYKQKCQ